MSQHEPQCRQCRPGTHPINQDGRAELIPHYREPPAAYFCGVHVPRHTGGSEACESTYSGAKLQLRLHWPRCVCVCATVDPDVGWMEALPRGVRLRVHQPASCFDSPRYSVRVIVNVCHIRPCPDDGVNARVSKQGDGVVPTCKATTRMPWMCGYFTYSIMYPRIVSFYF